MKAIFWCLLTTMLSGHPQASGQGVLFVGGSWQQVLQKAKRENKMIFLDCYASWCGPCKMMDQNVYTSNKVGDFFNERFVCVKLQMDTSKKDGPDIQRRYRNAHDILVKYGVNAYPTYLFFDAKGKAVHRGVGYQDTSKVIKMGLDAMDPDKQYYTLKGRYEQGERLTPKDFMSLSWMARRLEGDVVGHRLANSYIAGLSHETLMDSANLEFMYYFTSSINDRGFRMVKDSAAAIAKVLPRFSVGVSQSLAEKVLYGAEVRPFEKIRGGGPDWERIKNNLAKYGPIGQMCLDAYRPKLVFASVIEPSMNADPSWSKTFDLVEQQYLGEGEKYLFGYVIQYYEVSLMRDSTGDVRNLFACGKYCFDHFRTKAQAQLYNNIAFAIFQRDTVSADLEIVLKWAKYSIESAEETDPFRSAYMDTYANLLYKLGDGQQAIVWEEKAVAASPKEKLMVETLKKMKIGQPTW